tara:strand:+ start:523 stop:642 length:120 start_codon:yes stop_codon:yes gene_type:complete
MLNKVLLFYNKTKKIGKTLPNILPISYVAMGFLDESHLV